MTLFHSLSERIRSFLSHYPKLYALIAGIGIVLFWRGVWHSVDAFHSVIDGTAILWWDGPVSFVVGCVVLYFTGAFVSSFIGNELILSGLRGEKKLNQKTETEVKTEGITIAEIEEELGVITKKLEQLEMQTAENK